MLAKPKSFNGIGLVQVLLASVFVIWLVFFPTRGADFAWPIAPALSAIFIGASFIARVYLGFHLWREKYWWRLRWQVWGNLGFLAVIFVTTLWHVDEMNWSTNIIMAHIWIIAYAAEPLLLIALEPRGIEAKEPLPPLLREGPILPGLKRVMMVLYIFLVTLAGIFFLNPAFASTRWPWKVTAFDARIMSAFMILAALWALRVTFLEDWAEAKLAVRGLVIYGVSLFVVWLVTVSQYGPTNREAVGILVGVFTVFGIYYYWRQEKARDRLLPLGGAAAPAREVGRSADKLDVPAGS
jgi:hypothetical protein